MRIMVAVIPFAGHLATVLPVVAELVRSGHAVRVYTGAAYRDAVHHTGADRKGPRQMMANLEHLFIRTGAGQYRDLLAAWATQPWDVLVADTLGPGRGPVGRLRDSLLRGMVRLLTIPLHHAYNQTRADAGLPPSRERLETAWFSPSLICVFGTQELDYPRPDLPGHVHYVGMVHKAPSVQWEPPPW